MDNQQINKPPEKVIKKIMGKTKEFSFLKTVKSEQELDNFRFEVIRTIKNNKFIFKIF
jgi:hypothetical protein